MHLSTFFFCRGNLRRVRWLDLQSLPGVTALGRNSWVLGSGGSRLGLTPSFESGEEAGMGMEWRIVMLSLPTRISCTSSRTTLCHFQDVASGAQSCAKLGEGFHQT